MRSRYYEHWHPTDVLIEDAASGQSLLQELRTTLASHQRGEAGRGQVSRAPPLSLRPWTGGIFWVLEGALLVGGLSRPK